MASIATRHLRLRSDRHAPSAVRAAVRHVLAETRVSDLADDVMLLATELTTNAVLHAGTDLDVTIDVDIDRVHVSVSDGHRGQLPVLDTAAAMRRPLLSHGRGLVLVDQIATRWGVIHDKSGKSVWFDIQRVDPALVGTPITTRLGTANGDRREATIGGFGHPDGDGRGSRLSVETGQSAIAAGGSRAGSELDPEDAFAAGGAEVDTDIWTRAPLAADLAQFGAHLVAQLSAAADGAGVELTLDRADGRGDQEIARCGVTSSARAPLRIPLPITPPARGALALHGALLSTSARQIAQLGVQAFAVMVDNDRLRTSDLRRRAETSFITGASDLLAQSLQIDLTTALVPRLFVPRLGEWCAVLRCIDGGAPHVVSATHAQEAQTVVIRRALDLPANKRVLADAMNPGRHSTLSTAVDGVAVPLIVRGHRLGVLAVGRPHGRRHDADELGVIVDLARRTALALDNAQLHEERRTATDTLRQALLPPSLPHVDGVRFAAEYIPAIGTVDVGGDFYDVLEMPDGRWLMVLGDVSGKGAAAAAVTGLVRNVLRVLVREGRPVAEILVRINEDLAEQGAGRFATLAVAAVDARRPTVRAELYLAGHERPILVRTTGSTDAVGRNGSALGLLTSINVSAADVAMEPGDTLVFFTDGVTERRRGEELFGLARTHEVLAPLAGHDADVIAARLRSATIAFSPETPRDDIAILTMRNDQQPIEESVELGANGVAVEPASNGVVGSGADGYAVEPAADGVAVEPAASDGVADEDAADAPRAELGAPAP